MHAALISSLALASIAFAFPIETRDKGETFIKCDDQPYATGLLATVARTAYSDYENVYYGLDNSILATGADGNKDQVLVNTVNGGGKLNRGSIMIRRREQCLTFRFPSVSSRASAYSATNATRFEFIKCTSTYLGTDQSNGIYGYLQPVEKTTNGLCLQAGELMYMKPDRHLFATDDILVLSLSALLQQVDQLTPPTKPS